MDVRLTIADVCIEVQDRLQNRRVRECSLEDRQHSHLDVID